MLKNPEWRAARTSAISKSRRTLNDERAAEVLALRGKVGQVELARRYRVTPKTVRRIWKGEYAEG